MVQLTPGWLELEQQSGGRVVLHGGPDEIKAQFKGLVEALAPLMPPPSPNVEMKDGEVDGVKYRIYTPKQASSQGPLPVAMWFHAGGWMIGDLDSEDPLCSAVAEHSPSIVVSVDYRLTPEHKWPTQLQDCLTVYKWARQNASSIGGDPNKFYTIGSSAGGHLAFATANKILANPNLKGGVKGIVAMVPVVFHPDNVPEEYQSEYKAFTENGKDVPILDAEVMQTFLKYAEIDPKDKDGFPGLATDIHKNYPPTYIVTCEADPLRDDGLIMEKILKKAGVEVKSKLYEGLPHSFWINPTFPPAQQFVGELIAGVQWVIGKM